ncbi:RNA polymerase sigma factor SigJ [Streptomyces sp. URMC 129]|uniref:RNA polymerase sigma factor SigJ n=1 Tax=Streptomyces sp. URMC 129 TaxID=3423407 RepID=UPI003F1E1A7B
MSDTPAADPADTSVDAATRVFVGHRELLFSIVYNMLGSVADTEDVLQETWLSWARAHARPSAPEIGNPRAYLVRIAVNHALARQAAITRRREAYVGPWLPEPLVADTSDAGDRALRTESVSMALLVVLETLSPLERAVFVLHDVFGYAHAEVAEILGRSSPAVRQLARRAREHVHARRPRFRADPALQRQVTERFVAAALGGDIGSLLDLLAPDVTMWTDGGGKVRSAAVRPVRGAEKVARLMAGYASRPPADLTVRYGRVGDDESAVVFSGDTPFAVVVMDLAPGGDRVQEIYAVTNPEKLAHVRLAGDPGQDAERGPAPERGVAR